MGKWTSKLLKLEAAQGLPSTIFVQDPKYVWVISNWAHWFATSIKLYLLTWKEIHNVYSKSIFYIKFSTDNLLLSAYIIKMFRLLEGVKIHNWSDKTDKTAGLK